MNKDKIKVIYYGLDKIIESKNDKNLQLKKKYKIKSNQIILGCVARLVYQKSLDTLIKALSINNNKKKFVLFIAGSGRFRKLDAKKKPLISTNTSAMKELIFNNYNGYLIEKF